VDETDVLEGTGVDTTADLAHEIFLSQALMLQAIDGMGRKTEDLAKKLTENSFERFVPLSLTEFDQLLILFSPPNK
jgi:hypothetical protein